MSAPRTPARKELCRELVGKKVVLLRAVEERLNALGMPPGTTSWQIDAKARELVRPDRMQRVEHLARDILMIARDTA